MALDKDVQPALIAMLTGLTQSDGVTPLFKGVTEGPTESIPESPYVWVQNESWSEPEYQGSQLEETNWLFAARICYEYSPDRWNAEVALSALIEPIRVALRAHIKLGQ